MGKYSKPVTFAGASAQAVPRQAVKIDWAARIDAQVDIVAAIREHCGVQLEQSESTTQYNGRCPYPGCSSTRDSFIVWPHRSKRGQHYYCRKCGRSSDIITLLRDIHGWSFGECLVKLGLKDASAAKAGDRQAHQIEAREKALQAFRATQLLKLRAMYPTLIAELAGDLPAAYLASRGITVGQAQRYGLAYLPRPARIEKSDPLARWYGRILFPRTSPEGDGLTFAGRTLALWRPGMTPEQHKAAIDAHNAALPEKDPRRIQRHRTVGRGFFGYEDAARQRRIVLCEGEFDALSLMLAGINGVIAVGTTRFDRALIPFAAETIVLALDTDDAGKDATYHLAGDLQAYGLDVETILPVGKDWNDTLAECGADTIQALFAAPVEADLSAVRDKQPDVVDNIVHTIADDAGENRTETGQNVAYCCDRDETALAAQAGPPLCSTCLFADVETEAVCFVDDFNYCERHAPDRAGATITAPEEILDLHARLLWYASYAPEGERRPRLALDLETTGLDFRTHKIISVALGVPGDVAVIDCRQYYGLPVEQQASFRAALHKLFALPVTWIGHNLKFDWSFLACQFGVRLNRVYDTMLAEQLVLAGAQASKSLQATALRYGLEIEKEAREWFPGLDTRPAEWRAPLPAEQLEYIRQDIAVPCMVYARQQEHIERASLARVVALENEALPAIASMEVAGVCVDVTHWRAVLSAKQGRQDELERQLKEVLGNALVSAQEVTQQAMFDAPIPQINLSSSDQIRAALAALGIAVESISKEGLEAVKGKHPIIPALLEWKAVQKFTSAFGESVLSYVRGDGRIHAQFGQIGAVSGRIICHSPNLQQIPKPGEDGADIRRCFVAAPGHTLLIADLSNIELRILADVSRDETMLRFFADGKDLHAETARLMFGLGPDVDTKKHLIGGVKARDIAKTINFGLAYGMGAQGLANRVGVDLEMAKKLMQSYFQTYAGVDRYLRASGKQGIQRGYAVSLAGRRRQFAPEELTDYKRRGEAERSAKNHPIQATNADILKHALALLHNRLPAGVQIVLTVHDEVVLEAPEALTEQVAQTLKACMLQACQDFLRVVYVPEPDVLISDHWQKG